MICPRCGVEMQDISGEGARLKTWWCLHCQTAVAELPKKEE